MNGRFSKVLVIGLILCLFFVAFSQAKGLKLFSKPDKAEPAKKTEPAKPAEPAKSEVNQPQVAPPSKARIKFDSLSHNFGKVSPNSLNTCKFAFTNVGKDILKIDRAQGSCKCTVPDLQKKEYAPGESGEIVVEYHAPNFKGDAAQHVMVFSNDSNTPRADLEIKAYVQFEVETSPDQIALSLLDPNVGTPITLTSLDKGKFAVLKVTSTADIISIACDPNDVSEKHVFKPIVNMNNLRKNLNGLNGNIVFVLNHPKCQEITVRFTCLKEFETSPSVIILRSVTAGQVEKRSIYLINNYNQPIEIESVAADNGTVKVVKQDKTANKFQFDVEITTPPQPKDSRIFADMLHIKIKGKEEITIPCRGFYKPEK